MFDAPADPVQLSRRRFSAAALISTGMPHALWASSPSLPTTPAIEGIAADGQRLQLAAFKGRVVLIFYWSTGCAVCRDKMPELRANIAGWKDLPFSLFGVNMDTQRQDWLDYEKLVAQSVPARQRFASVWAGGSDFRDTMARPAQLPSACLVNKEGHLVERYRGRVPAGAWDRIADLI